jgi:thiol-disulfide isomerase/thioredoxin
LIAAPLALAAALAGSPDAAPAPPAAVRAAASPDGVAVMDLPAIKRALRGSRGHVVLVHFWATWCFPCLEELPTMERFARDAKARGVEVMSLSLDDPERSSGRVAKVLAERAPSLTRSIALIGDTDAFVNSFDREWEGAIPALFAYDAQGQLRGRIIGEATRRELDEMVARVLRVTARPRPAH